MQVLCVSIILLAIGQIAVNAKEINSCENVKNPLSNIRKKRHLTFLPGTAVVLTISLVKAIMTHAPAGWNIAIEIDVVCPMLSPEMLNALYRGKIIHRQKREFWQKIQNAFDRYNMNGLECVYRSICDAKKYLMPKGKSLVHDLLRAVFSFSLHEQAFKAEINEIYDDLLKENICEKKFECPISLIEFILALNTSN